jgi:hypothetical protein
VVRQCQEQQVIQGEGFATDASYVRADASWGRYATSISDLLAPRRDSRAVREYLDAVDEDAGLVSEQKRISQTDPLSRWMLKHVPARFYYCTNYLIDVEHNVIVDVEATPTNRSLEVESTQKMIDRVEDKLGITSKRLLADTAYGTGPMLDWLVKQKGIKPHIPVFDKTRRKDGAFAVGDFHSEDTRQHLELIEEQSHIAAQNRIKDMTDTDHAADPESGMDDEKNQPCPGDRQLRKDKCANPVVKQHRHQWINFFRTPTQQYQREESIQAAK